MDIERAEPGAAVDEGVRPDAHRRTLTWISWLSGGAILSVVIVVAVHHSEEKALLRLVDHAEPWWLVLATVLQVGTYFAQGEVFRAVARRASARVPIGTACRLSVAKLFVDQALPSAGISGTLLFARTLLQGGLARAVVMAAVVVDTVSYHAVYALSLAAALTLLTVEGRARWAVITISVSFILFCVAVTVTAVKLAGRKTSTLLDRITRPSLVRQALDLLKEADSRLVRNRGLNIEAGLYQLAIVVLDAGTIWVLVLSLGTIASPSGVFASFVISSLLRTMGVVPGGLGTFEAASVVTLGVAGVPLPVALSSTLLFRGLSFWFPLLPGLWFSRRAVSARTAGVHAPASVGPGTP